jgi:mannose-6-phosphate isomerase-like protein (cupin superfamily)
LEVSPNVTEAPLRVNLPVPVPSIYKDERGEIHNVSVGGRRVNLLYTRKGVMRSGDIHANTQHDFILSGKAELWLLSTDGSTEKKVVGPKEYVRIPPYVPHVFNFIEDSVMFEWWEPEGFHAWFYEPYRAIVSKSFTLTKAGELQKLIAVPEKKETGIYSWKWTFTGLVVGLTLGVLLGRRGK